MRIRQKSVELGLGIAVLLVGQLGNLIRNLLEARCLRVEEGVLDELQEQVGQPLPEPLQALLRAASVQHVGLSVDEVDDFTGEIAVPLLHCPLGVEQDVQSFISGDVLHLEALVKVHEFLGTDGEGSVHFCDTAIGLAA